MKHHGRWLGPRALAYLLISVGLPLAVTGAIAFRHLLIDRRYSLNPSTQALIGPVDHQLLSTRSYSKTNQAYYVNKADIGSNNVSIPSNSLAVGQGQSPYSLELPSALHGGITVYDDSTQLSITMTPQLASLPGRWVDGRYVYPVDHGGQIVYSVKTDGVSEDIVYPHAPSSTMTLKYTLQLPSGLEARLLPSGAIGVFSADPALYGNITYGSAADQLAVAAARQKGPKDYLVFGLPTPVVVTARSPASNPLGVTTSFQLHGNSLAVIVTGLNHVHGTFAVDPSVVVPSALTFEQSGNNEGNISFGALGDSISVAGLTGGSISAGWTATTSLPTATQYATSVAYNGYVYEIGGSTSGATATVDYAPINANGTLGSWTATTALPTATEQATSVAYNGYLYEIGGDTSSSPTATVDYAPINANGTLGSWTATTSLPTATDGATSVAYNGYVYEIGGYTSAVTAVVDYAPINSNGTLGSWSSTTSLPTATYYATSVAYNGYLYEVGGYTGSATATVDYAPINANGTLGSWSSTTSLPTATYFATSVAYNGYVYEMGGDSTSVVDYAPIDPAGVVSSWAATTSTLTATYGSSAVAYNGYLYILGGKDSSTYYNEVDYAPINSNGTIGSWTATTSFTTGRYWGEAAVYNGYLYIAGGCDAGTCSNTLSDVQYAPINADGTIGSWTATTSFTNGRYGLAVTAYAGYLYIMGGVDSSGSSLNDVQYAPINADGTIGSWTATTSFATAVFGLTAQAGSGYLYIMGGVGNGFSPNYNEVDYAPINANGTIGSWTTTTSFATARFDLTSAIYNGYLYILNGNNGSALSDVQYAQINNGGPGTTSTWTTNSNDFTTAREDFGSVAYNGYLYVMGGDNANSTSYSDVQYAPISNNGSIGTWATTTGFAATMNEFGAVAYDGYLYAIGGYNGGTVSNAVQYAQINANGTIGSWTATTSFTTARVYASTVAYDGYLYIMGGDDGNATVFGDVQYAPINANGTIGAWTATTSLPAQRTEFSIVAYDGYIYDLGGYNSSYLRTNTVAYAPINSNGTIGTWTATTSFPTIRSDFASAAYDGYLYIYGGTNDSGYLGDIEYAPINANGTVGNWTEAPNTFTTARDDFGSVAYNGYLYIIGGQSGYQTVVNDLQYSGLQSIPRTASFSQMIDFTGLSTADVNPIEMVLNGSNSGNPGLGGVDGPGGIQVQYAFASNACTTFNSPTALVTGAQQLAKAFPLVFTTDGCGNATALGRYTWVRIVLDDSQTASFPDSAGNHTSVTRMEIYEHPSSGYRLRGGASFQNQTLQTLDAPP